MIIFKKNQKLFLTIDKDNSVTVSEELPKTGITFEFETLTQFEYLELIMNFDRYKDNNYLLYSSVISTAIRLCKGLHNAKGLTPDCFGFDVYLPIVTALMENSTLSEDEKLSFV